MQRKSGVLATVGGVEIHAYSAFLFVGLTAGIICGTVVGRAMGVETTRLYIALVLLTIPALTGSRLLYVVTHWRVYRNNRALVWSPESGGAALYGGLLLALICSWPLLRWLDLSVGAFWDAATVTMLVGMIFTKIGCMLAGCCAGRPTSGWFGLQLPNADGVWCRRVPSQLMEGALAAALLLGWMTWSAPVQEGVRFLVALAIYGAARIALGRTRERLDPLGGVDVYTLVSVILVVGSLATLAALLWNPWPSG